MTRTAPKPKPQSKVEDNEDVRSGKEYAGNITNNNLAMEVEEVRDRDIDNEGDEEKEKTDNSKHREEHMEGPVVLIATIFCISWQLFKLFFTLKNKGGHMTCSVDAALHTK